jgi:hypothetical protein
VRYLGIDRKIVITRICQIHDVGFCITELIFEQDSKLSGSIDPTGMKSIDQLNKYELLKKDPACN